MKILIIGAGVIGCNIAKDMYAAGKDVTLLARKEWYKEIKENGLKVKNQFTKIAKTYHINVVDELMNADDEMNALALDLRKLIKDAGTKSQYFDELYSPIKKYL